jgi:hypothetical protein
VARFSAAFRSAGAGSSTLPLGSIWATAAVRPRVVEVGVFNTTVTAVTVSLNRFSAGFGTKGAAITPVFENDNSQAAVTTCANTHTVTPTTIGAVPLRQAALGAAVGNGVIWTFGGGRTEGLIIPNTTTDGMGIIVVGTGQICDIWFVWDE